MNHYLPFLGGALAILGALFYIRDIGVNIKAVRSNTGNHLPTLMSEQLKELREIKGILVGEARYSNGGRTRTRSRSN